MSYKCNNISWHQICNPSKKLKDLFIDNNRNGCTIRTRSSQTFLLRDTQDKSENCVSCELRKKGGRKISVLGEIELFFI